MDPAAMTVGAVVAAMVTKAAEEAAQNSIDGVSHVAKGAFGRLWTWLRGRFGSRPELARSIEYHGAGKARTDLARVIDDEVGKDPATVRELEQLVEDVKAEDAPRYAEAITLIQHNYNNQGTTTQSVYSILHSAGAADKSGN